MANLMNFSEPTVLEVERLQSALQMFQAQKMQSIGPLAGGIVHDFNNFLTVILAHTELAAMALPPNSAVQENLTSIREASRRAAQLCRLFQDYSGRGRGKCESIVLSRLVVGMLPLLKASISKTVALGSRCDEELPPVQADAMELRQVVMNLVINAAEAVGEREGVVSVKTGLRHFEAPCFGDQNGFEPMSPGTYVFLEVADNGSGMNSETQARIFEPFFSTKSFRRGLGLAAVRDIVRSHGGAIRLRTSPGQGTTFVVYLPVLNRNPTPSGRVPLTEEWRGSGTVLVVDDEETVRGVAAWMLVNLGFHVVTASDGREAIERFKEHRQEIKCVLLNFSMPRMGGEEAACELRKLRPDVPIVIASGHSLHEIATRFIDHPVAGLLSKPYEMSALRTKLRQVLSESTPTVAMPIKH
jgi:nitrogen-specific signal transduction histidine kinase/ActR/RegA family two-component response regulator